MNKTEWVAVPHPSASHWEVYGPNGFSIGRLTEEQARLIAAAPDMRDWIKAQIPRIEGAGEAREWTGYEGIVDEGNAILREAGAIK